MAKEQEVDKVVVEGSRVVVDFQDAVFVGFFQYS